MNDYAKYFGWDTDRQCTVYLITGEPVGSTPIDDALKIAKYVGEVAPHNRGTCKRCGKPYRFNNMSHHDKGFCTAECMAA